MTSLQAGYGDVQVLWDVGLEVGAGEIVCIIGSNGAGKTTLMRCLSGLLTPTAGTHRFDGRPMTARGAPADFVRRRHRPCAGRPPAVLGDERARQPADGRLSAARRRRASRRTWSASTRMFPDPAPSAHARTPARCPAASSRCARSAAG